MKVCRLPQSQNISNYQYKFINKQNYNIIEKYVIFKILKHYSFCFLNNILKIVYKITHF